MFRYRMISTAAAFTSLAVTTLAFAQPAAPEKAPPGAPAPAAAPSAAPAPTAEKTPATTTSAAVTTEGTDEESAGADTEQAEEAAADEAPPEPAPEEAEAAPVEEAALEEEAEEAAAEAPVEEVPPSLLPLTVGTHTFARLELRSGYDRLGVSRARFQEGDQTVFRTRLQLDSSPLQLTEKIQGSIRVSPQASGQWGASGLGGTIGEANAGLYEGYFRLKGDLIDGKVGRFAMNYGDALVIGNLDWHQSGRAFDGVHLSITPGAVKVDTFVTQLAEGQPVNPEPFAGDTYFYGAYAMFGPALAESLELDAYALGLTVTAADLLDATGVPYHRNVSTLTTLGLRAKQSLGMVDYRAEGGIQAGETSTPAPPAPGATATTRQTFAFQADGEIGVTPIEQLRVSLGGLYASGDDLSTPDKVEGWNELFPTGHKFLGLMDIIGARTNVASGNLKLTAKATASTIINLDAHLFTRVQDGGLARLPGSDAYAGTEIDAQLVQKIGKWAYVRGLSGFFMPGKDHYASNSTVVYGELQSGLKF